MNRKRAKELLPIIEAYANGAIVQYLTEHGDWAVIEPIWGDRYEYRIKPEPREFWLDPDDYEVWLNQDTPPVPHAIKVREVLE